MHCLGLALRRRASGLISQPPQELGNIVIVVVNFESHQISGSDSFSPFPATASVFALPSIIAFSCALLKIVASSSAISFLAASAEMVYFRREVSMILCLKEPCGDGKTLSVSAENGS